jgi:LPS export ABC transporter protein LptC
MYKFSLTIILLTAFLGMFVNSCSNEKVKPTTIKIDLKEIPDQESWNSRVVFSDSGLIRAILHVGHIRVFQSRSETLLENKLEIDFYDREQNHTSMLTADSGKVNDATNDLFAYGNVIVKSDDGVVLTTEELIWRQSTKKITTEKFVTITSPTEQIQGYGFESDQSMKNYVIFRVSGRIETKK